MSHITKEDYELLCKIADRSLDFQNADSDILERVDYLVTFGLAYYDEDDIFITAAGRHTVVGHKPAATTYRSLQPSQRNQEAADRQRERDNIIGESVYRAVGSLFRLAFVYLLGVFTPYEIRIKIVNAVLEWLEPIFRLIVDITK